MTKRRVLLVDDEISVLLTFKAVLEISGFDVETATSARDAQQKLKKGPYDMVITDMRMESDKAGHDVVVAARKAPYHPAVALLTAYPDDDWDQTGADQMLVKAMQTKKLIGSLETLLEKHQAKLARLGNDVVAAGEPAGKKGSRKAAALSS